VHYNLNMQDIPILTALVAISAVFPVFWLAVLLYRRNPAPVVVLYLSIQMLLAAYLALDILPGLFPAAAFSTAPLRPQLMLGIRALLFFLLPCFLHQLLRPPRAVQPLPDGSPRRPCPAGRGNSTGNSRRALPPPLACRHAVFRPYCSWAAYISYLPLHPPQQAAKRRVRSLVLFFAGLFPLHCAAALLRDYSVILPSPLGYGSFSTRSTPSPSCSGMWFSFFS
jgi:hypothetical protein